MTDKGNPYRGRGLTPRRKIVTVAGVNLLSHPQPTRPAGSHHGKAQASTLTLDPGLDWPKAFRVEIAAIDLVERFLAPPHVCERHRVGDVLILAGRVVFTQSL